MTDLTASTGGTAHQTTLPIPKSCFQKGGTYYLVLHVLDGHAMDYKDHKSKYAVESIASWQPKMWKPIPSPISLALTVPSPVLPNRTYTLTAAASDYWVQGTTTGSTADGISLYAWTASCGTFPSGTSTASVQWTSPAVIPPEGAHFSCTVDDTGTIGGSDLGSRDDAPVTTTEAALPPVWWDPYDPPEPIEGALIQGPQANSIWLCNSEVACSISDATDIDKRTDQFGAVTYPNDTFNNSDAYVWSATAGTFKDTDSDGQPNTRGKNVVWIAPATSCNATIKCRVKDDAIIPSGELGSRDDYDLVRSTPVQVVGMSLSASSGGGSGGGSTIMTGGVANPVHQATITATVDPPVAGTVTFSIVSSTCASGVNIPASLSASSVTLVNGKAQTVLTSSDLVGTVTVRASCLGGYVDIPISQADWDCTQFVIDPDELVADGQSTAQIRFSIVQHGTQTAVPGHHIVFGIDSVYDCDGNLVPEAQWAEYGAVTQSGTTDSSGLATGTFQVGTSPGTIYLKAEDDNVWVP